MSRSHVVIVGSGGGGGTLAWLLGKAGFRVTVLEQGPDWAESVERDGKTFNPAPHDEEFYRLRKPDPKRRLRGAYNTFRQTEKDVAGPFQNGWTGSVVGGGSVLWGTWSFRPLAVDLKLGTLFGAMRVGEISQAKRLQNEGYCVPDWPVTYEEFEPFFNVAETLLGVSGDRVAVDEAVMSAPWYKELQQTLGWPANGWHTPFAYPCKAYPRTPVGEMVWQILSKGGRTPVPLPAAIVSPGSSPYSTREALARALDAWGMTRPGLWSQNAEDLWSDRTREACNLCGFCGEYLCWGREPPKAGIQATTLREARLDLADLVDVRTSAKAFEIRRDPKTQRATGVRYLDLSDPDDPRVRRVDADYVVVSCGAVQSARLLHLSNIGNSEHQLGKYATFHLFGHGARFTLSKKFSGLVHGEYGHTGNVTCFDPYFLRETESPDSPWVKVGTLTSTAKKNPLEDGLKTFSDLVKKRAPALGPALLTAMERHSRTLEMRLTADDLPMEANAVDLDPTHVDEHGLPVARITRNFGPNEARLFKAGNRELRRLLDPFIARGIVESDVEIPDTAKVDLIGDHQMGTCRMGDDPKTSVVDRWCRVHDTQNVFVVDSSFMPTGLGLNPMVTVVANALRVGTWMTKELK